MSQHRSWKHFTPKAFEADWKYILELYFKCARMKTSYDDKLNVWEFMEGYDVKY